MEQNTKKNTTDEIMTTFSIFFGTLFFVIIGGVFLMYLLDAIFSYIGLMTEGEVLTKIRFQIEIILPGIAVIFLSWKLWGKKKIVTWLVALIIAILILSFIGGVATHHG